MYTPSSDLMRIDPLTGCMNYLGFLETLTKHSLSEFMSGGRSREDLRKTWINSTHFSAVLFADMNYLRTLNKSKGRAYGDSTIRWMGILLQEEGNTEVYRVGGVEFALLLKLETREQHLELIDRIRKRIEREAGLLGFPGPAADMVLIYFDRTQVSLDSILMIMGEAMVRVKNKEDEHFMIFNATDFNIHEQAPARWLSTGDSGISFAIRWISLINIHQVLEMGQILDETRQEAYTDAISGLPNIKAAMINLERALQNATAGHKPFSMMMIDGDNIRVYNSINYAAGDVMIRDMSAVFRNNLRPNDFIARWRSGDEFIAILPDTPPEGARIIGERFRFAVKEASRSWRFPVTISIGIASYPTHGEGITSLIDKAESANKHAKAQGKDRVVIAE